MTGGLVATLARTTGVARQFRELPAKWFSRANAMSGGEGRQQRDRPAITVRPRYRPPPKVTRPADNVLLAFDGTGKAEAIGPPFTNVVHLATHYGGDVQYFSGVGSAGQLDRAYGGVTGAGWRLRVRHAVSQLLDYVNRSPHPVVYVDIVGFSRGAAIARVVSNVMANHIGRGGYTREVKLRFLGLFDTVGTGMLRRPEHRAALLKIPRRTAYAVQAVAAHERRAFFPVASIEPSASNPGGHSRRREMSFIGAHTDIGGGYSNGDLSNLTLRWMMSHAQDVGAPMLPLIGRLDEVQAPSLHQQAGARLIIDRTGPGDDRLISYPNDPNWDPAAVVFQADRVHGITRAEAEQWIHRFPDVRDKQAGIVDVAAYTDELLRRGYFP